jgi:hypothetical protein
MNECNAYRVDWYRFDWHTFVNTDSDIILLSQIGNKIERITMIECNKKKLFILSSLIVLRKLFIENIDGLTYD